MERKVENGAALALRAGFTLIEILVAVAIIGILGTIATINITKNLEKAKVTAGREGVNNIKAAILTYNIHYSKYPTALSDLVTAKSDDDEPVLSGGDGALVDPWNTEYRYERKGKKILVVSAGPDGEFDTEDDIRSDKVEKKERAD